MISVRRSTSASSLPLKPSCGTMLGGDEELLPSSGKGTPTPDRCGSMNPCPGTKMAEQLIDPSLSYHLRLGVALHGIAHVRIVIRTVSIRYQGAGINLSDFYCEIVYGGKGFGAKNEEREAGEILV